MSIALESQLFYTTEPAPCPYLPDRTERKLLTELQGSEANELHDQLARIGFRRNYNFVYAPVCSKCTACTPYRIPVRQFKANRTMHRLQNRHRSLNVSEHPPLATTEQYALFEQYLTRRHPDGDMAHMSFEAYKELIETSPVKTSIVEFRTPESRLVCVSLIDHLSDGLSAVYTFYASEDLRHSYGTLSILWLIGETLRRDKPYLYLGYWVPGSLKMAYKAKFRPAEILRKGAWRNLEETA